MGAGKGRSRRAQFANARALRTMSDRDFAGILRRINVEEELYDEEYEEAYDEFLHFQDIHGSKAFLASDRMNTQCAPERVWEGLGREVRPGEVPLDYQPNRLLGASNLALNVFDISQTRRKDSGMELAEYKAREEKALSCNDFLEKTIRELGLKLINVPSEKKHQVLRKNSKDLAKWEAETGVDAGRVNDWNWVFAETCLSGMNKDNVVAVDVGSAELNQPHLTPGEARAKVLAHELGHALMNHCDDLYALKEKHGAEEVSAIMSSEEFKMFEVEAELFSQQVLERFGLAATEKYTNSYIRSMNFINHYPTSQVRGAYERSKRAADEVLRDFQG